MEVIEEIKNHYYFESETVLQILHSILSVKTKLAILTALGPRIVDPRPYTQEFIDIFRYAEDKEKVEVIIKARSHALSGTLFTTSGMHSIRDRGKTRSSTTQPSESLSIILQNMKLNKDHSSHTHTSNHARPFPLERESSSRRSNHFSTTSATTEMSPQLARLHTLDISSKSFDKASPRDTTSTVDTGDLSGIYHNTSTKDRV